MTTVRGLLARRWVLVLIVLITWVILATALTGVSTLELSTVADTPFTAWLRDLAASIRGNRTKSPAFFYFFYPVRLGVEGFIEPIRRIIAVPAEGNLIPVLGWLGVVALIGYIVYVTSNVRTSTLSMALVIGCGVLGVWTDSMDTLALTLGAVFPALLVGFPLGVWAGLNDRVMAVLRPGLDLAQILPTLVYLAPLALVFLIGIASATIATVIYSVPICIRITAHAVRSLKAGPVEAAQSMGSSPWQLLTKVQLPMARQTLILGVNQTTLAALSFVVIAALIGAPGLGKPVVDALTIRNVGDGLTAGLAVVLLAAMLDRATTAAVLRRQSYVPVSGPARIHRRIGVIGGAVATMAAIVLSRNQLWAAVFPERLDYADEISAVFDTIVHWFTTTFSFFTTGLNTGFTTILLNPLEGLLANSPWYLTITVIALVVLIVGGRNVAVLSVVLMLAVVAIGLWNDTMITLSQVLLATAVVMVVGVILGVIAGRSERADRLLKPVLDAAQTLPAFVYLVPVLALFGPTRFAAIVCGVVYAAPVVVRVAADGVKGVPSNMVEAAVASGSTPIQVITKVQLPASRKSLLLGANQGLICVLAVIVIGGLVGAGGLGYLVLVGQSKPELTGKGLAAGLSIVLLGIMLDRIANASAERSARESS